MLSKYDKQYLIIMDIGHVVELKVAYLASVYGIDVSIPCGPFRYDQIWDVNGNILKIQIKKATLNKTNNGIVFANCTAKSSYSKGEIDAIVTVYGDQLYFIPFDEVNSSHKKQLMFFINKEQSKAMRDINWAEDFIIEKQLNIEKIYIDI